MRTVANCSLTTSIYNGTNGEDIYSEMHWTLLVITKHNYFNIKTNWITSNCIKHCEKRLPLTNVVFEKEIISHSNKRFLQASENTQMCEISGGFFLSLVSCNFDDKLSQRYHRFVILCVCWDAVFDIFTKRVQCL